MTGLAEDGDLLGVGAGSFLGRTFPEQTPLIETVLPSQAGGWIAGEEKLGKTWVALEEAVCLALQVPVFGQFRVPQAKKVLFIEEEDSPQRTQLRLRALLRGHGLDPDDGDVQDTLNDRMRLHTWSGFCLSSSECVRNLKFTVDVYEPDVIYFDVLRKVAGTLDLNMADEANEILFPLDEIRRETGAISRLVAHYRKTQGSRHGRGSQELSGSYVLGAWGENSLFLEPIGRQQGPVKVQIQSKDSPPAPGFLLKIESEGPAHAPTKVVLRTEEFNKRPAGGKLDEQVLEAVSKLPTVPASSGAAGVPLNAILGFVPRSDKLVRMSLSRLQGRGAVRVVGKTIKQANLFAVEAQ